MLSNQDKKEMLEMIASCWEDAGWDRIANNLRQKALLLPKDKPERKMPSIGEPVLFLDRSTNPFSVFATKWHNTIADMNEWNRGLVFLMSERELAEKKCAELNKILAS